jgi:hypothetical protein
MKKFVIALMAVMLIAGVAMADKVKEEPGTQVRYLGDNSLREGGEDIATAVVVGSVPFDDTGDTSDNIDDYQWTTDTAPDVVYSFTPAMDMYLNVELCGSAYDTKLGIVLEDLTVIGYNDDACGLQSALYDVALTGGITYFIIVDGYGSNSGEYVISMTEGTPPAEGETCETAVELIDDDMTNTCPGAEFWYTFTAPFDGLIILDTCIEGQAVDTYIRIYDACGGTQLAYNDDTDCEFYSYASYLEFPVVEGQELIIMFDDNWSSSPFDFNLYVSNGVVATEPTNFDSLKALYR